tara:strand:+ start:89 stop:334 length:246 start_codon:yes stop_codon:yes gene_type:complete
MSRIFRESGGGKLYGKGVLGSLFSFLVFLVCYSAGYVFGIVALMLGLRSELDSIVNGGDEEEDGGELSKMLEKMNEEGPNN